MNEPVTDIYAPEDRKFQGATSPAGLPPSWLLLLGTGFGVGELARGAVPELMLVAALAGALGAAYLIRQGFRTAAGLRAELLSVGAFTALVSLALGTGATRMLGLARDPDAATLRAGTAAVAERDRLLQQSVAGALQVGRNALTRMAGDSRAGSQSFADLLSGAPLETGLVILAGDSVVAVAGPTRAGVDTSGAPASIASTPFHRTLIINERRDGVRVQLSLLLDALPAVPDVGVSLAGAAGSFERVSWGWEGPGGWEHYPSVEAAVAAVRSRMTVATPDAGRLVEREEWLSRWIMVAALTVGGLLLLSVGGPASARAIAVVTVPWVMIRSGVAPAPLDTGVLAALLVAGSLLMAAVLLWRRPRRRTPIGWVAAGLLLAGTPFLVVAGAGAIVQYPGGISSASWFAWQAALALAAAAILAMASAPLLSDRDRGRSSAWGIATAVLAVAAGVAGTAAWSPEGWPRWLAPVWWLALAAMIPATAPAARRAALAVTAGVMAALASWGMLLDHRVADARRDLVRLGSEADSATTADLAALGERIAAAGATDIATVYGIWLGSPLNGNRVPVSLSIWNAGAADPVSWFTLDRLAPTWDDLEAVVGDSSARGMPVPLRRGEALHQVIAVDPAPGTTVAVLVGPRSRLIEPTRLGRLIGWRTESDPPYHLSRRPDRPGMTPDTVAFSRVGRFVRTEQLVGAGEWPMMVGATVEIAPPRQFAVRGALVVLADVALVLVIWWAMERVLGARAPLPPGVFRRSYRRRVAAALIGFFLVPAVGFTMWTMLRLRQDVQRERVDSVDEALRDVVDDAALVGAVDTGRAASSALALLADRVRAELAVYQGGRVVAGSEPVMLALGVLPPVLDPRMVRDQGDGMMISRPVSGAWLGASSSGPGPVVAAALPSGMAALEREEADLALLLLLTSIAAIVAAAAVAGLVARGLGQPIEALRRRALAIGRRESADDTVAPPAEFEPVFAAIRQMELDLAESDARLEAETARSARVVAWGEMARQVAHEIKNPLTPMRLGLQHLRRLGADGAPDLPERTAATAERLLAEIDRLDRIARAFARYGAPPEREEGPLEMVDLAAVVAEMADLYRLAGAVPGITVDAVDRRVTVAARSEELRQVILNLVDNSRQAGARNVTLVVRPGELVVSDDGRGIPEDQVGRLFEPTFSTTSSGTGLGLAIVRRLVEGWGATISVSGRHGEGASFRLSFPPTGMTPPA